MLLRSPDPRPGNFGSDPQAVADLFDRTNTELGAKMKLKWHPGAKGFWQQHHGDTADVDDARRMNRLNKLIESAFREDHPVRTVSVVAHWGRAP